MFGIKASKAGAGKAGLIEDVPKSKITKVARGEVESILDEGATQASEEMVIYRRVQGGTGNKSSWQRVIMDNNGNMYINDKTGKLNVSIDNGEHAKYYIENRRPGADIYEFDVPKWFDDMVQEYTIPKEGL